MMNESNCSCQHMPVQKSEILLVAVYSIVFAIGLPANCFTAYLTWLQIKKRNILAIYLFSLSLCELMYLSTLPLWIVYVQNEHQWTMGSETCIITGYIFFCNIYISILMLCCISIDRYVAVVYSLESRGTRDQRTAVFITVVIFALVAVIHCPVFFLDDGKQTLEKKTCFETLPLQPTLAYFGIARSLCGFIIPFAIISFTNYKIFQNTNRSSGLNVHQKAKVKYLAIAIIIIFLMCFAPYHVVLLIRAVHYFLSPVHSCCFEQKIYTTFVVFLCFSTANSIADPIIYVLASNNVRKEFYSSLRSWQRNMSITLRTDSAKSRESQDAAHATENKTLK
ncbi:probable G-protein coupled receptor 132 [Alligator mississippiensis]|uniref:probable G-protein coupled receptor 132 n=1 Tax=Alligator mississippiensis TaxID=8496 RepID=UPI0006EC77F0|nr:probable G-protein coupled receptor 132 [Alligator mississippiensis]XP_019335566.1 probable G-protein coupled receptor 132 [Alligator mississippiensis]XP_059579279.1 probable G-protein coupled receptor 132 [Alligator mississippiensis]